ncbi:amino acid ABC transporter permease [Diaminobutyricibacter tongyongensis]|uniref:Amino acid ABC transporter permease n=1 Tax=Leifsonia tongyongensis TaxID=1268043 RepID=A0A6L9XVD7_9MICO|nr:amino acid ABC transporter permease [Diaminobutyricibacter tongyongensis]NEN04968.1 amino acid ABC transporter permease [Diaminobutyricibacter tongyongensis]
MIATSASYTWDWSSVLSLQSLEIMGRGLLYTLLVSVLALIFGNVIGLIVASIRMSNQKILSGVAYVYIEFFRTTPALVQLIWIFYVVPILFNISLDPITAGVVALSMNAGAFLAEIFRGGIQAVPIGQRDASFVLGLSRITMFWSVVFPQAVRTMLPATGNVFVSLVKDSSLLSVIAVPELTYQAQQLATSTFRPLEVYTLLAVTYFIVAFPLTRGIGRLEKRLRKSSVR